MKIHEKIREYRVRKGLSQENMADLLKMSATNYGYIEQGKVSVTVEKLEKIAQAFGTDVFDILTLGENQVYYIQNQQNDERSIGFVINSTLPSDYQTVAGENIILKQRIEHLQEKIKLLEDSLDQMRQIVAMITKK